MRNWNLAANDPRSLTLAADYRLSSPNYCDDHIWELFLDGGEPPALALQTTFGLRARSLRLFPRFSEGELVRVNPIDFTNPPIVRRFYPNYLLISFSPFPEIDVDIEYWVPQSQAVGCRIIVTNSGTLHRHIRLDWVAILNAAESGERMSHLEIQAAKVLYGRSSQLVPVVFLTGGPEPSSSPYPALSLELDLPHSESHKSICSHAALSSKENSFELARQIASNNWDAEFARIEMINNDQVEIFTGDPDWDAAFSFTQKVAYSLFLGSTSNLPNPSFVFTRQPDQGYSLCGDGSDYDHLWNGQSPLDTYTLVNLMLPSVPGQAQGLIRNFITTQTKDGFIDWKPGLAGQRSSLLATPILATLTWRIFQTCEDKTFLEEVFPHLLNFFHTWFTHDQDRDGDGIPEWDHPLQAGFEDHPLFACWHKWAQGLEISTTESPALCAFLYRECQSLIRIAQLLGRAEPLATLQAIAEHLKTSVETSWDDETATYHYWDRDTHSTTPSEVVGERMGPGKIEVQKTYHQPVRLVLRIESSGESTRRPNIFLHGISSSGKHRVERITQDRIKWYFGIGTATSELVYSALEHVEIQGLDNTDLITIKSAHLTSQDLSLLLPLWASIPSEERAKSMVRDTITNQDLYWRPFGIPACTLSSSNPEAQICNNVYIPWNTMIGEGLVIYGYRSEAAELVSRLMLAIINSLKTEGAFYRNFHAETGHGSGEKNSLGGLAPIGLFLETLGVRLISPHRVAVEGYNPYPWPVTVKYCGLTVIRQKEKTLVIFPDGQSVNIDSQQPRIISLE